MANFNQTLDTIYAGGLAAELDEKLTEVVRAAELTGKTGSISVTLKIKAKGSSGQIEITPAVKALVPEHERGNVLMFATPKATCNWKTRASRNSHSKTRPSPKPSNSPSSNGTAGRLKNGLSSTRNRKVSQWKTTQ